MLRSWSIFILTRRAWKAKALEAPTDHRLPRLRMQGRGRDLHFRAPQPTTAHYATHPLPACIDQRQAPQPVPYFNRGGKVIVKSLEQQYQDDIDELQAEVHRQEEIIDDYRAYCGDVREPWTENALLRGLLLEWFDSQTKLDQAQSIPDLLKRTREAIQPCL